MKDMYYNIDKMCLDMSTFSSIRRGVKWALLEVGEEINNISFVKKDGMVFTDKGFVSEVDEVYSKRFKDLCSYDTKDNFDKECRNGRDGWMTLYDSMFNNYFGFNDEEIVTIVRLKRKEG